MSHFFIFDIVYFVAMACFQDLIVILKIGTVFIGIDMEAKICPLWILSLDINLQAVWSEQVCVKHLRRTIVSTRKGVKRWTRLSELLRLFLSPELNPRVHGQLSRLANRVNSVERRSDPI